MNVGEQWAYREPPFVVSKSFSRVEVMQFGPPKSQKVRVRLLDGEYFGLDQWVPKGRLTVPWEEADAYLADEVRYDAVLRSSRHVFGTPECEAAWMVFHTYPRPDGIIMGSSSVDAGSVLISDLTSVCGDLGCVPEELLADPLAYLDRHGEFVAPWSVTLPLAQRVADRFPQQVLDHVRGEQIELEEAATHGKEVQLSRRDPPFHVPAERYVRELHDRQSVFALVRSWCGYATRAQFDEAAALRAEVERLREWVSYAAGLLKSSGHPLVASRLLKAIREPAEHT